MSPRPNSTKFRREVFDANKYIHPVSGRIVMDCHLCGLPIDPAREPWEAEHVTPHFFGGTVGKPAHPHCHKPKTAKDQGDIAKSKRVHDKHFNIRRKQGFRKPPEGYEYSWKARRVVKIGEDVE